MSTRPFVTYDSTLLDHVSIGAASSAAWTSLRLGAALFLTALTAAAAQVSVHLPFTPVPFTLQPMVVLVGAATLGSRLGAASQILYLLLGVAGLPVFAASPILPQGAGRLLGPTGGYLMAYPVAAFVTGWLAERGFVEPLRPPQIDPVGVGNARHLLLVAEQLPALNELTEVRVRALHAAPV